MEKYIVVRHDGNGQVRKEDIEIMESEALYEITDENPHIDEENIVCYFPVEYLLQGKCFGFLKNFFTVK